MPDLPEPYVPNSENNQEGNSDQPTFETQKAAFEHLSRKIIQDGDKYIIDDESVKTQKLMQQQLAQQQQLMQQQMTALQTLTKQNEELRKKIDEATKQQQQQQQQQTPTDQYQKQITDYQRALEELKSQVDKSKEQQEAWQKQQEEDKKNRRIKDELIAAMYEKNIHKEEIEQADNYLDKLTIIDDRVVSVDNMAYGVKEFVEQLIKARPYIRKESVSGGIKNSNRSYPAGLTKPIDQYEDWEKIKLTLIPLINEGKWPKPKDWHNFSG